MGKAVLYGVLGTLAAVAILAVGLILNPTGEKNAKAATPHNLTSIAASPIQRCMNMGGALEADNEGDWGYTIRQQDLKRLKQAGFDTIRVPIKFSAHTSDVAPFKISPAYLKRVDEVVDWSILAGLQIIIDVHHYEELMEDADRHEPRLQAIWEQLAYHYATAPENVMFELINEPFGDMTIERTDLLNTRLLQTIRQLNPDRWVVIGSAGWGTLDALLKSNPPRDPKVITTFHYYDPFEFSHQGAAWAHEQHPTGRIWPSKITEPNVISMDMARAAQWRDKTRMPMLLGEFGAIINADTPSRARWSEAMRLEAEKHGIGWCYWEWGTQFAVYDLSNEAWVTEMRRALVGR